MTRFGFQEVTVIVLQRLDWNGQRLGQHDIRQERLSQGCSESYTVIVQTAPAPKHHSILPIRNLFQTCSGFLFTLIFLFILCMILNQHYETYLFPLLRGKWLVCVSLFIPLKGFFCPSLVLPIKENSSAIQYVAAASSLGPTKSF